MSDQSSPENEEDEVVEVEAVDVEEEENATGSQGTPKAAPAEEAGQDGPPPTGDDEPGDEMDPTAALSAALAAQEPRGDSGLRARPSPSARRASAKKNTNNEQFKALSAPVLITVGGLLLVPAIWAVLLLTGQTVWASDRPNAQLMAKVMLVCWLIAIPLMAAGFTFGVQVLLARRARQRAQAKPL